jgi:hypothetical protein
MTAGAVRWLVVVACALLAAGSPVAAQQPSPPASPPPAALPYIGGTRSSAPGCRALRDAIAPAVLDLMRDDELIGASRSTYRKMAHQSETGGDLGRVGLGRAVTLMARNLGELRTLLDDPKRFPRSDDPRLQEIRTRLRETADRQEAALNVINGVLETDLMAKMMGKRGGRFGITPALYALVADGLKAHQSDVAASEEKLTPSLVELSHACGGAPSPSPSP